MNSRNPLPAVLFGVALLWPVTACAQGTAFTYQGQLKDTNGPVNGNYDFLFRVFDSVTNGVQQGITVGRFGVGVSNGLFTTTLDYGSNVFTGLPLWLDLQVAPASTANYETLAPRQRLTSTPYALHALEAGLAATATSVPWLALSGIPPGFADGVDDNTFYSAGTGLTLVGTTFSLNTTYSDARYWKLSGNSGTSPGVNFLGTTDNQALELKVNGVRALRLEPNSSSAPNVIGGAASSVNAGVYAATISGGSNNVVSGHAGSIAGGRNNLIQSANVASTIGGGEGNTIATSTGHGTIGGGYLNTITTGASGVTIGGGQANTNSQDYATIGGGLLNLIMASSVATISGGTRNKIMTNSSYATISGGQLNTIMNQADHATIAGGFNHDIGNNSAYAAIGGGNHQTIESGASSSTIAGGASNSIHTNAYDATIGGGVDNEIGIGSAQCTVGGGVFNRIGDNVGWSTISGGSNHEIQEDAYAASIGGGYHNRVLTGAAGGTIPGGYDNDVLRPYGFAAGRNAKANHPGAFVWADSQAVDFASTATNQVSFRCQGGVRFTSASGGANQTVSWTPGAASWSFSSDRALKENFVQVDPKAILEKLTRLPLNEWNYIGFSQQRHIGPTAQDFHSLFPLNDTDTMLNDADLHGITLAAIQGLTRQVAAQDAEIRELKERLAALERLLGNDR